MLKRIKSLIERRTDISINSEHLLNEAQEIAFGGERVTHLYPNDCYYAHLSIYWFAKTYAKGCNVLDAGCGGGYGTNYLAENGANNIVRIDISNVAIQACKKYFSRPNLSYRVMDLANINGFEANSFDLIFSSNALEHVVHVKNFFDIAFRLLKSDGSLILAVPPVVDKISRKNNIDNPYHLNVWTPAEWKFVLSQYFDEIQCFTHSFTKEGILLDFANTPEKTKVNESDFTFNPIEYTDFYKEHTLTVMFVVRKPRNASVIPDYYNEFPMVDDSFSRQPIQ